MLRFQTKSKVRTIALVALVIGALGLPLTIVIHRIQPRSLTVANAQARLVAAQRNLERATHAAAAVEGFSQQLGGTTSTITRIVRSIGDSVVEGLWKENVSASINGQVAGTVEAADCCIRSYTEERRAQEAMAALKLAGITQVIIRPPGGLGSGTNESVYDVMVPLNCADTATAVLHAPQIYSVKTFEVASNALQVMQALEARRIPVTISSVKTTGSGGAVEGLFTVHVRSVDAENAQGILGWPSNTNAIGF